VTAYQLDLDNNRRQWLLLLQFAIEQGCIVGITNDGNINITAPSGDHVSTSFGWARKQPASDHGAPAHAATVKPYRKAS